MPDAVTFTKFSAQTVATRVYSIEGAPPVKMPYGSVIFRPSSVRVTITDGTVNGLTVSGPRLKKDGADGQLTSEATFYGRREYPAWIVTFLEGMGL